MFQNCQEVKAQVKAAISDHRHHLNSLPQRWFQHHQQQKKQEATLNTMQVGFIVSFILEARRAARIALNIERVLTACLKS